MKIVGVIGLKEVGKTELIKKIAPNEISKTDLFSISLLKHGNNKAYIIGSTYDRDDLTRTLNVIKMSNSCMICIPGNAEVNQFFGELILLAQYSDIKDGIIVITMSDSSTEEEINSLKKKLKAILANTKFKDSKIVVTSSITEEGIDELREEIMNLKDVEPKEELDFEIDSAREIKKDLTNVYGFLKGGKVKVHDQIKIMPWGKEFIVQSLELENETIEEINSPERLGIGFKGLFTWDVKIGDIICNDGYQKLKEFKVNANLVPFYKDKLSKDAEVILNVGLQTMKVRIEKIIQNGNEVESFENGEAELYIKSEKLPFALKNNMSVIIINPDANWRTIKFAAHGKIII